MRLQKSITQYSALGLVMVTFVATVPVSAAEIAPANIGSVSAVGSVQLRGVGISEGTLFSGDRLNVAPGGYAKVVLGAGPKVEVGGSSDVTVSRDNDAISIQMMSGNIAFSGNGQKPVRVRIGAYEVMATGQSKGSVAFIGSGAFGIRVLDGTVSVRNTSTKQSFTVVKGSERLISLGDPSQSGALLASAAPTAIPAAPRMPAAQLSGGVKTALIVGAIGGSAAAIALLMTKNDDSDTEAANRLAKTQTLNNVAAIAATADQEAQAASTISSTATAALNVINTNTVIAGNAANRTALLASANALIVKANNAASAIQSLRNQINALQAQIELFGTVTPTQQTTLNSLLAQVEAQRAIINSAIEELVSLISRVNTAAGTNAVTNPGLTPIGPPNIASPSNP